MLLVNSWILLDKLEVILLMYNRNKNGFNIDFCGILELEGFNEDVKLFKIIFCFLFYR